MCAATLGSKKLGPATYGAPLRIERPKCIEFGIGKISSAGQWATNKEVKRTLVISDQYNAVRVDQLDLPGEVFVQGDLVSEPDLISINKVLAVAREVSADLIIGFGGGSVMDTAKLVSVLVSARQSIQDIAGVGNAPQRGVFLMQVPTTSGTGSEVGSRALVTDPGTRQKISVESTYMLADVAIIDPVLTVSLPSAITATTGIDALAHCVEAFTSTRAHPLIDMYARQGIELVGKFLGRAVRDGGDLEARAGLCYASCIGGYCLGPVNTTAGHAISYPLGTRHNVAHGLANAVIFPHTLAFNQQATPGKTREIAGSLGFADGDTFAGAYQFCSGLGIGMRMGQLGVSESDLEPMVEEAFKIRRLLDYNPRKMSKESILEIYKASL
ncbi:iron-containing alcohol dehydrogenase [Devosia rhodophyticola]|uniref:Iron-containing alcohol dehydrogenase n=1 Tax=Devosia rhodophyticola TaxID=3026423 RepID=A0ABY7Z0H7_9HYPH|nr:iron-containing alcohol dehydrogenase [Devosia rhodophyticola]WDR07148.1 iron-containing alcohol dehydrogenase [Devosia rhodophyticola]